MTCSPRWSCPNYGGPKVGIRVQCGPNFRAQSPALGGSELSIRNRCRRRPRSELRWRKSQLGLAERSNLAQPRGRRNGILREDEAPQKIVPPPFKKGERPRRDQNPGTSSQENNAEKKPRYSPRSRRNVRFCETGWAHQGSEPGDPLRYD